MEEAIFAQAGAAAVKGLSKPSRNVTMAPLSGVKFSDVPPSAGGSGSMSFGTQGFDGHLSGGEMGGVGVKWSEYMQDNAGDDDSPWSSLDAFADNPESSAQFAVPLHLQEQQKVMQASAQQYSPHHHNPVPHQHPAAEAFASNTAFINQQSQPDSEEAMFAQAGAEAVARMLNPPSSPYAPPSSLDAAKLSHIDDSGSASMVDVSPKATTFRSAIAIGRVYLPSTAASLIRTTGDPSGKGPVLHTAQLAGIMAAKRTSDLIPLCHPLPLTHVDVKLDIHDGKEEEGESWISVECTAKTAGQTGVEMEALTGCMGACLTVWDMVKAVAGRKMRIGEVMVVKKEGGKSGDWVRNE